MPDTANLSAWWLLRDAGNEASVEELQELLPVLNDAVMAPGVDPNFTHRGMSLLALACQGRGREMERFSELLVPGPLLRAEPLALADLTRFPLPGEAWAHGQHMHAIFEEVAARLVWRGADPCWI